MKFGIIQEKMQKYWRNTGEILDNSDTIRIIALVRCVVYVGMSFCEKCRQQKIVKSKKLKVEKSVK